MTVASGAYPIVPPLPEHETRTSSDSTRTSGGSRDKKELSDLQKQAMGQQEAVTTEQIDATGETRRLADAEAAINLQAANRSAEIAGALSSHYLDSARANQDLIDNTRERVRAAEARYQAMPAPALFADGDSHSNARKAIAIGLAGLGDAIRARAMVSIGRDPGNLDTVGQIVERDIARQKSAIDKQKDHVVMAKSGLNDAMEARKWLKQEIDLKGSVMYGTLEKQTRANLAALGFDKNGIEQHQAILGIKQKAADKKWDAVAPTYETVQSNWNNSVKKGTDIINRAPTAAGAGAGGGVEAAKNSANYNLYKEHGEWLAQNANKLSEEDKRQIYGVVKSSGFADTLKAGAAWVGVDQERSMSPLAKEYLGHMREAADGYGRVKSGGAINKDEEARFVDQFVVKPSDKEKDVENRANNIRQNIRIMSPLDRGQTPPAGAAPGAPPAAPSNPSRDKAIRLLRENPDRPGAAGVMKRFNITPEELRGG